MDKILHDPKDPKLWELWYIPYYGSCRILSISRTTDRAEYRGFSPDSTAPNLEPGQLLYHHYHLS